MPDHIKNKGAALCLIGAYFFEKLSDAGFKTHYEGMVERGNIKTLKDLSDPVNTMQVKLLRVIKPDLKGNEYDYGVYQKEKTNMLIPLEIIYRNSLPEGSSIFKRLHEGQITLENIGLKDIPQPGQVLDIPIIDVSTKLESTDRDITWKEAQNIAALTDKELRQIKDAILKINEIISGEVVKLRLINNDGKMEFGFNEHRELIVVDVIGTPDECRFTFDGIAVSKEMARIYYRNTDWFKKVNEAKKKDPVKWKEYVGSNPPHMPERLVELISGLYQSFCNELTKRKWFDVPTLKDIIAEINCLSQMQTKGE